MVCLFCLVPLFLIPLVNALPLLFDLLMGKFYTLMGWEYRKPERVAPACPYKPAANNGSVVMGHPVVESLVAHGIPKALPVDNYKSD